MVEADQRERRVMVKRKRMVGKKMGIVSVRMEDSEDRWMNVEEEEEEKWKEGLVTEKPVAVLAA